MKIGDVSIVVPVLDEAESLPELVRRILAVAGTEALPVREIVFVDDGSSDASWKVMSALARENPMVSAIRLRRNFGKATALDVGIASATGAIVVTMDADLQDDPDELPKLLAPLSEAYDLVSGWKRVRNDPPSKTLPSRLFNWVTAKTTGLELHDFNCGYKAYRREIFDSIHLYGELHRYVPVLAHGLGYRVAEVEVLHHARRFGRSKYGLARLFRGFLDLLTVLTLTRFSQRPGHFFGGIGLGLSGVGFLILSYLTIIKLALGESIGERPLLQLGVLLMIVGVQMLFFGLVAELIVSRTAGIDKRRLIRDRVGGTGP